MILSLVILWALVFIMGTVCGIGHCIGGYPNVENIRKKESAFLITSTALLPVTIAGIVVWAFAYSIKQILPKRKTKTVNTCKHCEEKKDSS